VTHAKIDLTREKHEVPKKVPTGRTKKKNTREEEKRRKGTSLCRGGRMGVRLQKGEGTGGQKQNK